MGNRFAGGSSASQLQPKAQASTGLRKKEVEKQVANIVLPRVILPKGHYKNNLHDVNKIEEMFKMNRTFT